MSESLNGAPGSQGYLVSDLIGMALEVLSVGVAGQNADAQGVLSGVRHLNSMLGQWQRRRWLVPNLVDRAFLSTGTSVYYIGPGGDLDIPVRPSRIVSAYCRLLGGASPSSVGDFQPTDFAASDFDTGNDGLNGPGQPIDYPLSEIEAYEDYSGLGLKGLRAWPRFFHYNPCFPLGEFRPWPIPTGNGWEFHLLFAEPLPSNLTANSPINLPPEYWDAIMWSLAVRLAPSYGQPAPVEALGGMRSALATLRASNSQIATLGMPSILSPRSNPFWWPGMEIQKL